MKPGLKYIRVGIVLLAAVLLAVGLGFIVQNRTSAANGTYKILAWNDLGMHCYNRDFADLAVLPPYNNLWVQVVQAGDPPKLVTTGITVTYAYADNTYSVGKTNFWTYAKALFGVDLAPNVGLKGKGLSGSMDLSGDHFIAEGIPLTEFSDSAPTVRQPYQLATVVVKNSVTGEVLATQSVVTPTSSEMRCDNCHSDTGIAKPHTPTGKVETNILALHDQEEGTKLMASRPVLCASCHGSNALGAPGKPGLPSLSKAMHSQHTEVIPNTLDGCYNCHPGPQTRCLRDVMSTQKGMTCIDCHGTMTKVASNPNPWLNEPRCDTCHNSGKFNQDQALYRVSKDHGGLYCEACHDSTHAIAPSREANDAIKFMALQGKNGPLGANCSVCHTTPPSSMGPHGISGPSSLTVSGNAGAAGVTLGYVDGTLKTTISAADGSYSLTVPSGWAGTVTPTKAYTIFTPANRSYASTPVTTNLTGQDFSAAPNLHVVDDFNGDGKTDLAVFRKSTGYWYIHYADGSTSNQQWGNAAAGDIPAPGDYNGDGKTDYAVWRQSTGIWYVKYADGSTYSQQWGNAASADIPVPGDYNGDGKTDLAYWRPSNGTWYIHYADGTTYSQQWGNLAAGDRPMPGDYNGDGKTDFAVFRKSTGYWYIRYADGSTTSRQWGNAAAGDIPMPGDYNGDGLTELAVWRQSTGVWYIKYADDTSSSQQWGNAASGDMPVSGDFNGDGQTDYAVWRPSNGTWYVHYSDGSAYTQQWGNLGAGDSPLPPR